MRSDKLFIGSAREVISVEIRNITSVRMNNTTVEITTNENYNDDKVYTLVYENVKDANDAVAAVANAIKDVDGWMNKGEDILDLPAGSEPIAVKCIKHLKAVDTDEEQMKKLLVAMLPSIKDFIEKNSIAVEKIATAFEKMGDVYTLFFQH